MSASRADFTDSSHPLERLHNNRFRVWVPPLLWILMIAFGGGQSLSAQNTFVWLARFLAFLHLKPFTIAVVNFILRKTGHFLVYGTLSFLLFRAWRETVSWRLTQSGTLRLWSARAAALAVASSSLVASLDEFHQAFSPGRTSSVRDVILDTFGAVFAQMLLLVLLINRRRVVADTSGDTSPRDEGRSPV